jgi:hypothetical protein
MAGPNSRKTGKILIILIAAIVVVLIAVGSLFFGGGSFDKLESLPANQFLDEPTDFLGNEYSLKAQIDSQLKWDKEVGRLIAVKTEMSRVRLPVFVPASIEQNLQTGQRYEMHVRIENGGLIYVEKLRKY